MGHYIGLLRGVNVGGNRKVPMADLKRELTALGYANVRTLLASGNFVFEGKKQSTAALERKLETELAARMGLETDIMVRTPEDWEAAIAANPFPAEAASHPSRLLLMALKSEPAAPARAAFASYLERLAGPERVIVRGREVFVFFPEGQADSKLNLKALGSSTGRNWNTVLKLRAMVAS
ncbi:MAG: DUF1697 domain-containing protein [Polyangiaceae bacterium]|nr:DUF1697 domain-containing protein [Polyangiaceae bacterium]